MDIGSVNPQAEAVNPVKPQAVPQFTTDPWIYRIVVGVLGIAVVATVIGGLFTANMPQGVLAIGSAAVGGLVGLLVPSPVSR